jgi:hypothetical protein
MHATGAANTISAYAAYAARAAATGTRSTATTTKAAATAIASGPRWIVKSSGRPTSLATPDDRRHVTPLLGAVAGRADCSHHGHGPAPAIAIQVGGRRRYDQAFVKAKTAHATSPQATSSRITSKPQRKRQERGLLLGFWDKQLRRQVNWR